NVVSTLYSFFAGSIINNGIFALYISDAKYIIVFVFPLPGIPAKKACFDNFFQGKKISWFCSSVPISIPSCLGGTVSLGISIDSPGNNTGKTANGTICSKVIKCGKYAKLSGEAGSLQHVKPLIVAAKISSPKRSPYKV